MPKKTKVEEEKSVPSFEALLQEIVSRLDKIENTINKPITSQAETLKEPANPLKQLEDRVLTPELIPVPQGFRAEVDQTLNKEFGVEIEPRTDAPVMTFTIIVPDKYSLMTPSQREIMKRDIRPKVITTAGGVNEVKEWSESVFKNLTPEIQAMVVADRMKG